MYEIRKKTYLGCHVKFWVNEVMYVHAPTWVPMGLPEISPITLNTILCQWNKLSENYPIELILYRRSNPWIIDAQCAIPIATIGHAFRNLKPCW